MTPPTMRLYSVAMENDWNRDDDDDAQIIKLKRLTSSCFRLSTMLKWCWRPKTQPPFQEECWGRCKNWPPSNPRVPMRQWLKRLKATHTDGCFITWMSKETLQGSDSYDCGILTRFWTGCLRKSYPLCNNKIQRSGTPSSTMGEPSGELSSFLPSDLAQRK